MPKPVEITGFVRGTGQKYLDGTERLEIWVNKKGEQRFLNIDAMRVPVTIAIGPEQYTGGVSFTRGNPPIWINPDLKDKSGRTVSLANALRMAGVQKNQKVVLKIEKWKICIESPGMFSAVE